MPAPEPRPSPPAPVQESQPIERPSARDRIAPPRSYVEALTRSGAAFGHGAHEEGLGWTVVMRWGPRPRKGGPAVPPPDRADAARRQPWAARTTGRTWSRAAAPGSGLPGSRMGRRDVYGASPPVCAALYQQWEEASSLPPRPPTPPPQEKRQQSRWQTPSSGRRRHAPHHGRASGTRAGKGRSRVARLPSHAMPTAETEKPGGGCSRWGRGRGEWGSPASRTRGPLSVVVTVAQRRECPYLLNPVL